MKVTRVYTTTVAIKMYPRHRNALIKHSSSSSSTRNISSLTSSSSSSSFYSCGSSTSPDDDVDQYSFSLPLVRRGWGPRHVASSPVVINNPFSFLASVFRSLVIPALRSLLLPTCHQLQLLVGPSSPTSPRRNKLLTGTFFGRKKGRVSFAVQETPRSDPILLLDLATQTAQLAKEMASGAVRILLECESSSRGAAALLDERVWTMHCNDTRRLGYAVSRTCGESDLRVLGAVRAVSVGAGVVPPASERDVHEGEVMYMRAKFERVIGGRDSEAFYMISPDCGAGGSGGKYNINGGPELSIFLLRI